MSYSHPCLRQGLSFLSPLTSKEFFPSLLTWRIPPTPTDFLNIPFTPTDSHTFSHPYWLREYHSYSNVYIYIYEQRNDARACARAHTHAHTLILTDTLSPSLFPPPLLSLMYMLYVKTAKWVAHDLRTSELLNAFIYGDDDCDRRTT